MRSEGWLLDFHELRRESRFLRCRAHQVDANSRNLAGVCILIEYWATICRHAHRQRISAIGHIGNRSRRSCTAAHASAMATHATSRIMPDETQDAFKAIPLPSND